MNSEFLSIVIRKLITTFVTVTFSAIVFSAFILFESSSKYDLGNDLMQIALVYVVIIGVIVIIYGNAVSTLLEYSQKKFKFGNRIYILLHGLFGMANGLLVPIIQFAILGMVVALLYAIIDRWILARSMRRKSSQTFLIVPVLLYGFCWALLQAISPSLPYYTKEEAVSFATSGKGTAIELFPNTIGEKIESIDGYKVLRETKIEELKQEVYIVTFTERWSNEQDSGEWFVSYKVKRGQLSAYDSGGENPPYR